MLPLTLLVLALGSDGVPSAPRTTASPFPEGTREVIIRAGQQGERSGKSEGISQLTTEIAYYVLDDTVLRLELVGYGLQDGNDSLGIGLNVGARYHFLHVARTSFFAEGAGGILGSTKPFPDSGTRFNFTYYAGIGASHRLTDETRIELSARFQHVSNGFVKGRNRNPATNTYGGTFGISVKF